MTTWCCPICRTPYGVALQRVATSEAFARDHAGVLPDSAELAAWQLATVRADVQACITSHTDEERAALFVG